MKFNQKKKNNLIVANLSKFYIKINNNQLNNITKLK